MRLGYIWVLLFLLTNTLRAETTLIQGNAFSYRGQNIEIHQYLDLFTFRTLELADQHIPENGNFKFNLNLKETDLLVIKIGKVSAHLFVQPGEEYTLVIPEPYEMDRYNPSKDVFVMPEIFEGKTALNQKITEIEKACNGFIIDHTDYYRNGVSSKIRKPADSLVFALTQKFEKESNAYLKDYLHYRLAEFELNTGKGRKTVYQQYFKSRTPSYKQLSYCNAFNIFYVEQLYPGTPKKFSNDLEVAVTAIDFKKIMEIVALDSTLDSPEKQNLLVATQFYFMGAERVYPRTLTQSILDSVKVRANEQEIKLIAQNAQEILMNLAPGTKSPDFKFTDIVGNVYRLNDYGGKYLYIQFFDQFTPDVLRQMSLMKVLKEGYGVDIAMFSISLSETPSRLKRISEEHDFDWFFGRSTNPYELRELYNLRALPAYFFIDADLNLVLSPAPEPGGKIEMAFAAEWKKAHPNKPLLFKLQPPEVSHEKPALPDGVNQNAE